MIAGLIDIKSKDSSYMFSEFFHTFAFDVYVAPIAFGFVSGKFWKTPRPSWLTIPKIYFIAVFSILVSLKLRNDKNYYCEIKFNFFVTKSFLFVPSLGIQGTETYFINCSIVSNIPHMINSAPILFSPYFFNFVRVSRNDGHRYRWKTWTCLVFI